MSQAKLQLLRDHLAGRIRQLRRERRAWREVHLERMAAMCSVQIEELARLTANFKR